MNSFMKNWNFGGGGTLSKHSRLTRHIGFCKNFSGAFTLAEVLVTLGIIGVVSAMTLPTLVKNHQRQVYVTQLQKVVSEITQAVEMATTEHNAISFREAHVSDTDFLKSYFKIAKTCTDNEQDLKTCFADEYKNLNGNAIRLRDFVHGSCAVITNGASICVNHNGDHITVSTDINGKKGPNIYGRDLFVFMVGDNAEIFTDTQTASSNLLSTCSSATKVDIEGDNYGACLTKLINDGWKMDY